MTTQRLTLLASVMSALLVSGFSLAEEAENEGAADVIELPKKTEARVPPKNSEAAPAIALEKSDPVPIPVDATGGTEKGAEISGDKANPANADIQGTNPLDPDKGIYLSLVDCIEIAVQNNLGLKINRLDDRKVDLDLRSAWAKYFPEFNAGITHSNSRTMGQETGDGNTTVSGGVTQRSPWGTTLDFSLSATRSRLSNSSTTAVLPGNSADQLFVAQRETRTQQEMDYSLPMGVTVTQPLWKGFGTDVGMASIRSARINRLISRGNLELNTQTLVFLVKTAYTDVIRNIQNLDVNQQAVRSAQTFLNLTRAREQAGQETKLDVFNAEVQLHSRELLRVQTEGRLAVMFDALKRIMDVDLEEIIRVDAPTVDFGEKSEPGITKELVPDETAGTVALVSFKGGQKDGEPKVLIGDPKVLFRATRFDEPIVLSDAMENRIDLINQRRVLAIQKIQTLLSKDGLGQEVNLTGSFTRNNDGFQTGFGDAQNSWSVGVEAVIPWGKISDKAAYEKALLDLQKVELGLKQVKTNVHMDVRRTMRELRELEKTMMIGARQVEQAKRSVEANRISYERGIKDSYAVIKAEDDLLSAKTSFVNSNLDYIVKLAEVEKVVGKSTGRIDLSGRNLGGIIDARIPDELKARQMPQAASEPEARPEDDPFSRIPGYRKDYKDGK